MSLSSTIFGNLVELSLAGVGSLKPNGLTKNDDPGEHSMVNRTALCARKVRTLNLLTHPARLTNPRTSLTEGFAQFFGMLERTSLE